MSSKLDARIALHRRMTDRWDGFAPVPAFEMVQDHRLATLCLYAMSELWDLHLKWGKEGEMYMCADVFREHICGYMKPNECTYFGDRLCDYGLIAPLHIEADPEADGHLVQLGFVAFTSPRPDIRRYVHGPGHFVAKETWQDAFAAGRVAYLDDDGILADLPAYDAEKDEFEKVIVPSKRATVPGNEPVEGAAGTEGGSQKKQKTK